MLESIQQLFSIFHLCFTEGFLLFCNKVSQNKEASLRRFSHIMDEKIQSLYLTQ